MLNKFFDNFLNKKTQPKENVTTSLSSQLGLLSFDSFIMEIFGEPGSGKTTYIYSLIAELQRANKTCLLVDAEFNFDRERAIKLGMRLDECFLSTNNDLPIINKTLTALAGFIDYLFIDSLAALRYDMHFQDELSETYDICKKNNITIIFTNQMRQAPRKAKNSFGHKEIKFLTDIRIKMEKGIPTIIKNRMVT